MKKTAVLLTALLCAGLVFSGTAGASLSDDAPVKISADTGFGESSFMLVLHPMHMLLTDSEADKFQALADMVWLPAADGAPAGLYYPKLIPIILIPDLPLDYSSYWEPVSS